MRSRCCSRDGPKEQEAALKAAGVDIFVFAGGDAIVTLTKLHRCWACEADLPRAAVCHQGVCATSLLSMYSAGDVGRAGGILGFAVALESLGLVPGDRGGVVLQNLQADGFRLRMARNDGVEQGGADPLPLPIGMDVKAVENDFGAIALRHGMADRQAVVGRHKDRGVARYERPGDP